MTKPINDFQPITPFKFWCQQVLPLVYDDSLSYYETLCKLKDMLNKVITSQNELGQHVTDYENYVDGRLTAQDQAIADINTKVDNSFAELLKWVNTQLETYTKEQLQAWLDDGTLQSLIANALNIELTFDTTSLMTQSTVLVKGNKINTLGFYTINDGGGAHFVITDTIDSSYFQIKIGDLYANLIQTGKMSPLMYGAHADGVTDDSTAIQNCVNFSSNIGFNHGNYLSESQINLKDNIVIDLEDAIVTFKLIDGFVVRGQTNVTIMNGTLYGTLELVTKDTNKCPIRIQQGENIKISNITIYNAEADGIMLTNTIADVKNNINIFIDNCNIINAGRNGISVSSAVDSVIRDCFISGCKTYAPRSSIDLEINFEHDQIYNLVLNNIVSTGSGYASLQMVLGNTTKPIGVDVNNWTSLSDSVLGVQQALLYINNNTITANRNSGYVNVKNFKCYNSKGLPLWLDKICGNTIKTYLDLNYYDIQNNNAYITTCPLNNLLNNVTIDLNTPDKNLVFTLNNDKITSNYQNLKINNKQSVSFVTNQTTLTNSFYNRLSQLKDYRMSAINFNGVTGNAIVESITSGVSITKQSTGTYTIEHGPYGCIVQSYTAGVTATLQNADTIVCTDSTGALKDAFLYIIICWAWDFTGKSEFKEVPIK